MTLYNIFWIAFTASMTSLLIAFYYFILKPRWENDKQQTKTWSCSDKEIEAMFNKEFGADPFDGTEIQGQHDTTALRH